MNVRNKTVRYILLKNLKTTKTPQPKTAPVPVEHVDGQFGGPAQHQGELLVPPGLQRVGVATGLVHRLVIQLELHVRVRGACVTS